MKPEEGGSWFFLVIEPHGLIIDSTTASSKEIKELANQLEADGISPMLNDEGAWKALIFHEDFSPYSAPESIKSLASYIEPGTVITLDNGCMPSIEWRFTSHGIEIFDTFDYVSK